MLKYIVLLVLFTSTVSNAKKKEFPIDGYFYKARKDVGMAKYSNRSLYGTHKIILTFDDGPHLVLTPKLLDILKKYDVTATFFILTEKLKNPAYYKVAERAVREGHFLASHDFDHDNNNNESRATFKKELKSSALTILNLNRLNNGKHVGLYYRFPYGAYGRNRHYHHMNIIKEVSNEIFQENCINFVFWDIDTIDWVHDMTPEKEVQNVLAQLDGGIGFDFKKNFRHRYVSYRRHFNGLGGGVILFHDIHANSVKAVDLLLSKIKNSKYKVVPMNTAKELSFKNKSCIY